MRGNGGLRSPARNRNGRTVFLPDTLIPGILRLSGGGRTTTSARKRSLLRTLDSGTRLNEMEERSHG